MSRSWTTPLLTGLFGLAVGACEPVAVEPALEATDDMTRGELVTDVATLDLTAVRASYNGRSIQRQRRRWLRRLRRATAEYRRFSVAYEAGYNTQATPCQETDAGGMGYHYADFGLLDGLVEETRPEILLYEPRPGGRERLVAVEYAVPYSLWPDDEPPELYGVPFVRNDVFGLWVLHAWVFKRNPAGTFEGWNPRVSCRFDTFDLPS